MKRFALAILIVLFVFGLMPSSVVSADGLSGEGVSPTPWFTIIGGYVTIAGQPASVGTNVDFFCQENLAGHGVTDDFSATEQGILGFTHVYGSDLSSNPQILACEEGDQVKVFVNGMRAVMSPIIYWTNDWTTHLVAIDLDSQVGFVWGEEVVASVGVFEEMIGLREWSVSGVANDITIAAFPFWVNYPAGEAGAFSLTNTLGKTKVYSSHDESACPVGPIFSFSKGGGNFIARVENPTGLTLQVILQLDDQTGPAGLLSPGGSFEIRNTAQLGSIEVLVGDENGPLCANLEWDYREIPAPRVVFATGENRTVTIKGDNFFPYLGAVVDPEEYRVWFIRSNGTAISYNLEQVWDFGGTWESRQIRFNLPENFPTGTYMLKVSMNGRSSDNDYFITVPGINYRKIYLPIITR